MQHSLGFVKRINTEENKFTKALKNNVVHDSFKFIVNPRNTTEIEITSFLQYCALKNNLSNLTSNNIKPLKYNKNPVLFTCDVTDIDPDASFTKYALMSQSEKNAFKTKTLKKNYYSLFFNALSDSGYLKYFKERRGMRFEYRNDAPDYFTVDDLYIFFMEYTPKNNYLPTYIPKNSCDICYVQIPETTDFDVNIYYNDNSINFDIIDSEHDDKETVEEFTKLVNCINESTNLQISKNDGHIENTYDNFCVYTEDPTIIHKVLMNNQRVIDTMRNYIIDIKYRQRGKYSQIFDILNELQTSITNVVNAHESIVKKTKDNLAVLNDLFN